MIQSTKDQVNLLISTVRFRADLLLATGRTTLLWGSGLVVAAIVLTPIVYLLIRTLGADATVWSSLFNLRTLQVIGRTLWLVFTVTTLSAIIALPLGWFTVRTDLPLRRLWMVLTVLPLVIPSYVGAYLVVAAFGPRGMLQGWLESLFGVQRLPDIHGFPGALLVLTLLSYPYILLNVQAGLLRMNPDLEDASRSLGYGAWVTFWRVTFPQLRPAMISGGLLVALYTLRDFGAVSIMRYNTFTPVIYIQYGSSFDRRAAAALGLVLVAITLTILVIEMRMRGRAGYYESGPGSARPPSITPLGRWLIPALFFCITIVGLGIVMPAGVLVYWLVRGMKVGESIVSLWGALVNSLAVAGLASAVALVAALPVVILSVRRPNRLSHLLERLTYSGFALPGIVVALALVFFGIGYARPLYQTFPMLIVAYTILFLPQAVGAMRASLLRVSPSLEEAARSLGRRPAKVFTTIVLPLMRPGVIAGGGLVFLTTMKELPATLILGPFGFKTLATTVWSSVSEAFFAQAAAPALLLILGSSLPMAFLMYVIKRGYYE